MERLAIMGVGSLGTILGAHIAETGRRIDLIDVNREHVDALNQNGASAGFPPEVPLWSKIEHRFLS